jgi:hypothetical protein
LQQVQEASVIETAAETVLDMSPEELVADASLVSAVEEKTQDSACYTRWILDRRNGSNQCPLCTIGPCLRTVSPDG